MDAAGELEVLFPDRAVPVRDPETGAPLTLTVREFRFREGLEATALARPLIAALAALVPSRDGDADADAEGGPDALAVEAALAAHAALWLELVARACDREAAWLARLDDADGRALSEAMWAANGGFFCAVSWRRWRRGKRTRGARKGARHPRPGRPRTRPLRPRRAPDMAPDRPLLPHRRGPGSRAVRTTTRAR